MDSAVGRLRRTLALPLLSLGLLMAHPVYAQDAATSASAPAKISVTILPVNGIAQKTTCDSKTYKCALPLTIQTAAGKTEALTVNIYHVPGNTLFSFQTPKGFLYAGDKPQADPQYPVYRTLWGGLSETAAPSTANLTLYEPYVANAAGAPFLSAPSKAIADLQITVEAAP